MFDTLISRLIYLAEEQGDHAAICFRKEVLTYRELLAGIRKAAGFLHANGVKAGERVLYSAVSRPMATMMYLGIQYVGAVAVHIDKNSSVENALAIYDETEAVLFLTDMRGLTPDDQYQTASLKKIFSAEDDWDVPEYQLPDPEAYAEMIFTSGTTGRPKGVILSYRAVHSIYTHTREGIGITPDEVVLIPLPIHHSYGLRVLRATLDAGATVVLQNGFGFAGDIEKNLDQYHCTGFAAVPASMEMLRTQMQDRFYELMGRFRYIEIGAGALTLEQRKRLTKMLPDTAIYNTWGSSETGGVLFTDVREAVRRPETAVTIGRAPADAEVIVTGENGQVIEVSDPEHTGRLSLKGEMLMSGYWNRPELTEETLRDGQLLTGDIVYQDSEGYVYMLGRADDLINVGGEKVSPLEIENAAGEYPYVRECACIGVKEEQQGLGQVPVLYLAISEGYTEEGLIEYLSSKIERIKLPHHYVTVEAIPRNRMQKIDRKAIHALWEERSR